MTTRHPSNKARKHHFLPECYLKGWAGSDGRLVGGLGLVKLARFANARVIERARRFVYGQDTREAAAVIAGFGSNRIQSIGEKMAMVDPWGRDRPPGYGVEDAVADYVEWVRARVEAGAAEI
jgi:hypothetical protein